ncbi:DUF2637 domain-containing protein [Streptomyces mirabilis]|uniref:DUF2637 domain-containing protein n=1 Tax=Streptomyces mirabilis TaxID=68239 RepID=UPI0031BAA499
MVDAAVVIVVRLDAVVARLGGRSGLWPAVLRWMTGLMTLLLNAGDSALKNDLVGVAVHSVAPLLLIVTAEAGLAYRRAISAALERIERSRATAQAEREQREQAEREHERQTREHAEHAAREHAERLERERAERESSERAAEREHTARMERERLDREAELRREQREYEDRVRHEKEQRSDALRREQQEQAERSRRERAAIAPPAPTAHGAGEGEAVNTDYHLPNVSLNSGELVLRKMPESEARSYIASFREGERTVRQLAEDTGWSVGWVAARVQEAREERATEQAEPAEAVA